MFCEFRGKSMKPSSTVAVIRSHFAQAFALPALPTFVMASLAQVLEQRPNPPRRGQFLFGFCLWFDGQLWKLRICKTILVEASLPEIWPVRELAVCNCASVWLAAGLWIVPLRLGGLAGSNCHCQWGLPLVEKPNRALCPTTGCKWLDVCCEADPIEENICSPNKWQMSGSRSKQQTRCSQGPESWVALSSCWQQALGIFAIRPVVRKLGRLDVPPVRSFHSIACLLRLVCLQALLRLASWPKLEQLLASSKGCVCVAMFVYLCVLVPWCLARKVLVLVLAGSRHAGVRSRLRGGLFWFPPL